MNTVGEASAESTWPIQQNVSTASVRETWFQCLKEGLTCEEVEVLQGATQRTERTAENTKAAAERT
jgi:hypothetical protein